MQKQNNQGQNNLDGSLSTSKVGTKPSWNQGKPKKVKSKCSYCKKLDHDEHKCIIKQIKYLTYLLGKNNKGANESSSSSDQESTKKNVEVHDGNASTSEEYKGKSLCSSKSV